MRSLLCLIAMAPPVFACPAPPPPVQVVANESATISPEGGVIVRVEIDSSGDRQLTIHADGAAAKLGSEAITSDLYVMRPRAGMKQLEVMRDGKVASTMRIVATPPLAAPKLAKASSTASRAAPSMYPQASQFSVEVGDAPAGAYALVVYKVERDGVRSVAHGKPSKRVFAYRTGGKDCYGLDFEPIFTGERIAVAWLDVHGRLSARSAVMTVGR